MSGANDAMMRQAVIIGDVCDGIVRGAFADKLPRAQSFKAWLRSPGGDSIGRYDADPVDLPEGVVSEQDIADALASSDVKGWSLIVLFRDEGQDKWRRNRYSVFYFRNRVKRRYVRLPDGSTGQEPRYYAELVAQYCAPDGSEPIERFRATRDTTHDDIVGIDRTLVEGGAS